MTRHVETFTVVFEMCGGELRRIEGPNYRATMIGKKTVFAYDADMPWMQHTIVLSLEPVDGDLINVKIDRDIDYESRQV